jgi:hypothetical protein
VSIYFILPFSPSGVPVADDFDWKLVNYAPIVLAIVLVITADHVVRRRQEALHRHASHRRRVGEQLATGLATGAAHRRPRGARDRGRGWR